uniref:Uncharacterized protein n=1 Tax=Anopheles minimus TaxID=112268 RepID=A0A182WCS4_9DIPT
MEPDVRHWVKREQGEMLNLFPVHSTHGHTQAHQESFRQMCTASLQPARKDQSRQGALAVSLVLLRAGAQDAANCAAEWFEAVAGC